MLSKPYSGRNLARKIRDTLDHGRTSCKRSLFRHFSFAIRCVWR